MRDAHRIREKSPFADVLASGVRGARTLFLIALAFTAGRWTAPNPPARSVGEQPTAAEELPPLEMPNAAPVPVVNAPPRSTRELHHKERKQKPLIVSDDPQALADGLLPEQIGSAKAGEYSVQIASFASRQEARAFCQQLTRRGFHPHVAEIRRSSQPHRVRLGRFAKRDLAHSYRVRLAQADITATVVQVD